MEGNLLNQSSTPTLSKLHHAACGCPGTLDSQIADADAAAAAAASQVTDSLVSNYHQLYRLGAFKAERRLRVAYVIPHHRITGGIKVLCQHVQLLRQRGHHVVAVYRTASTQHELIPGRKPHMATTALPLHSASSHQVETATLQPATPPLQPQDPFEAARLTPRTSIGGSSASAATAAVGAGSALPAWAGMPPAAAAAAAAATPSAMPAWSGVVADEDVLLGPDQHLAAVYPGVQSLDVIVCGMFQQVPELLLGMPSSAAVIYYEQGHEWLFGDPLRLQAAHGYAAWDRVFHMVMGLPAVLACVSEPVRHVLQTEFGRGKAVLLPNGVDTELFRPGPGFGVVNPGVAAVEGVGMKHVQTGEARGSHASPVVQQQHMVAATGDSTTQQQQQSVHRTSSMDTQQQQQQQQHVQDLVGSHAACLQLQVPTLEGTRGSGPGHSSLEEPWKESTKDGGGDHASLQDPWLAAGLPAPTHAVSSLQVLPGQCLLGRPCLLLVGDPNLKLKGFDVAVRVLQRVVAMLQQQSRQMHSQQGTKAEQQQQQQQEQQETQRAAAGQLPGPGLPLLVTWVCQQLPGPELLEQIRAAEGQLVLGLYVQPPQALLPSLYNRHQVLLFTSHYEAWGMPVLEAMASGLAVVSTSCGGVMSFTKPGEDCLVATPGNVDGLAHHVMSVLEDPALCARLQLAARSTACRHSLSSVAQGLEELLYATVAASGELLQLRQHPLVLAATHRACLAAIQAAALAAAGSKT